MHFLLSFDLTSLFKARISFLPGSYLLKFNRQSMKWTFDHNVIFVRQILHMEPWLCKYGSTERGEAWSKIDNSLNAMKEPSFKVTQRSVRDRYTHMERNHKTKVSQEDRASGTLQKKVMLIGRWKK